MAELAARSGVSRETIHFYLREGLLPRPRKGGRTVAYYGADHLDRLRLIRRLREEKYLPLAVIRRLLDAPGAAAEQDLDALSEVLNILPAPKLEPVRAAQPPAEALTEAVARDLLGPSRPGNVASLDPAERRVLSVVSEALLLEPRSRALTLDDLGACAADLSRLVAREAAIFFDAVLQSADIGGSIAALRAGRGPVARFITAYRDLMLRRIVEDLLVAIEGGPDVVAQARTVPLSDAKEKELGTFERRAELEAEMKARKPYAAARWIWHLFACGLIADLAAVASETVEAAGPRAAVLAAWGGYETERSVSRLRALERAADAAADMALGQILVGEAILARRVRRRDAAGQGFLDAAVPALHRIVTAHPERDPEPVARAFGYFLRGRVEIVLPPVLGRRARGADSLARALAVALDDASADLIEPSARVRIAANARLLLGRYYAALGDPTAAQGLLEEARATDPTGPIAVVVRHETKARR
jgi:DNA-binding transcriptional MerR regulator